MEFLQVMEMICLTITFGFFFAGLPPSIDMYKTGNTKNVPYFMFLMSIISCSAFTHYAYIIGIPSLVFLNGFGTVLNILYVYMYIAVVSPKTKPVAFFSVAVAYITALYTYLYQVIEDDETRAAILGGSSSSITTILMLLPIVELVDNFKNKNADGMPPVMLYAGLLCSISWLIYGLLLGDANVYFPNIPGLMTTTAKLAVIQMYGGNKAKTD